MKQDLWLANSSLLLIFALSLMAYSSFFHEPPVWRTPKTLDLVESEKKKEQPATAQMWEKIYQDDLFGTYVMQEVKAVKQNLITPIPELKPAVIPPPPEVKKQEFIPPLNITLRGIIAGGDELRNVAMIADETNKEEMYHLGEKIKDAQIIKIAHNRIILLRANGQQETFFLRKDEIPGEQVIADKWKYIARKVDDQNYEIDPTWFVKEVETLGNLFDRIGIIGTAYQGGKALGIRLGKPDQSDVVAALGLMENDIITSVNDLDVADQKNRIKAYDSVTRLALGSIAKLGIKRADKDISLSYKLVKIDRPRKSLFPGIKIADAKKSEEAMKMNRLQQREQTVREFNKIHPDGERHQQAMMEIRRRILENLQNRLHSNNR